RKLRKKNKLQVAPVLTVDEALLSAFIAQLGFSLTAAQHRVIEETCRDMAQAAPMMRLVQGDVGSGKTVVAAYALLLAVGSGYQAALMAPTDLLAEQHKNTLLAWFNVLGVRCAWLTGKLSVKQRREALAEIAAGTAQVIIGTHALFQEGV